jgi:hypothetical protein
MGSRLGDDDVYNYLVHVYFGPVNNAPVKKAVSRAYRDFNRTLRGFGIHPGRAELRTSTREYLEGELTALGSAKMAGQADFDSWHETTCAHLKSFYGDFPFTVGQSQKWINMAIKYLFVLDRERVETYWQYCHVPIDKILLKQLKQQGLEHPPVNEPWSRLDEYGQYLDFQTWFRGEFAGFPMDNEFEMWMKSDMDGVDDLA